ncbi:MAG: molybdopterin-binding/glycosyltransferase family 2 protein [Pseudomonadota bacterium]
MKFGPVPVEKAEGCYLAHALKLEKSRLKKGHFLTADDITAIRKTGIETLLAATLEDDDVHEEAAAERIAAAISGDQVRLDPPFTGRVNLFASEAGILRVDKTRVDQLNRIHPAITFATLADYAPVEAGRMIATVKIIPFAAPSVGVIAAEELGPLVSVSPFVRKKVALVATKLPALKEATMDKTRKILEDRLARAGADLVAEIRVAHDEAAICDGLKKMGDTGADLIVLFGASATVDEADVGPAGLVQAGGTLHHFGMPVDPGNLLFVGGLSDVPVIGAPGCARAPAENGFDWILHRLLAGIDVNPDDITSLGVGGLLMEITSRPQPREGGVQAGPGDDQKPRVSAVLLAAGQSRRMGAHNKLTATVDGITLVRRAAEALLASKASEVVVVTGHQPKDVEAALSGLSVRFVHNPDYADGLSTSLRVGISALGPESEAALIALADMPFLETEAFDRVIDAFTDDAATSLVVATSNGKRGNPVLWSRRYYPDLMAISGDTGARHLIGANEAFLSEVEIGESAALDLDTPEALRAAGGRLPEDKA